MSGVGEEFPSCDQEFARLRWWLEALQSSGCHDSSRVTRFADQRIWIRCWTVFPHVTVHQPILRAPSGTWNFATLRLVGGRDDTVSLSKRAIYPFVLFISMELEKRAGQ